MRFKLIEDYLDSENQFWDYKTSNTNGPENLFDKSVGSNSWAETMIENPDYAENSKNRVAHWEMLTPNEYYEMCHKYCFPNVSVETLKQQRGADKRTFNELKEVVEKYHRAFPATYIDRSGLMSGITGQQEGLHRMYFAGEYYGWDKYKYPVLIIDVADETRERKSILYRDIREFVRYDFKHCTEYAESYISDKYWDSKEVPNNFNELWCSKVEEYAKSEYGKDIECDIEYIEQENHHRVETSLLKFEGFDISASNYTCDDNIWMEDLFYHAYDTDNDDSSFDIDDYLDNDLDLDDELFI